MVPVPPPRVELPSAASLGTPEEGTKKKGRLLVLARAHPKPQQPQKALNGVSNPDLSATNLRPPTRHYPSALLLHGTAAMCILGSMVQLAPKIPCFHLTSLLKVWYLGLKAGRSRATSPLPSAAMGLPVPLCPPDAACSAPLPGCCLRRKTSLPPKVAHYKHIVQT